MTRSLPLAALHAELGANFVQMAGWKVASHYGDPRREYAALVETAGVLDATPRGAIEVTGVDRMAFLQGLITNDLRRLEPGGELHACHTDQRGHVVSDLRIHHRGDRYLLETEPGMESMLRASLEKYRVIEDVAFEDMTGRMVLLRLAGPAAFEVAAREFGAPDAGAWVTRREDAMGAVADVRLFVVAAEELLRRLAASGAAMPVGFAAWDSLRIERGVPRGGAELDGEIIPLEAGLEDAVSYDKGCYLGQEAIAKMHYRGKPRQRLVSLVFEGSEPPPGGTMLFEEGGVAERRPVGRITSVAQGYAAGRPIGLGFLARDLAVPGARFEVGSPPVTRAEVRILLAG